MGKKGEDEQQKGTREEETKDARRNGKNGLEKGKEDGKYCFADSSLLSRVHEAKKSTIRLAEDSLISLDIRRRRSKCPAFGMSRESPSAVSQATFFRVPVTNGTSGNEK